MLVVSHYHLVNKNHTSKADVEPDPTIGAAYYALSGILKTSFKAGVFNTKAGRIPIHASPGPNTRISILVPHDVHVHQHQIGDLQLPIPGLSIDSRLIKAEMKAPIVSIVKGMTFLLVALENLDELGTAMMSHPDLSFRGLLDKESGWGEGFVARYYYVIVASGGEDEIVKIRTRMLEAEMEDPATYVYPFTQSDSPLITL